MAMMNRSLHLFTLPKVLKDPHRHWRFSTSDQYLHYVYNNLRRFGPLKASRGILEYGNLMVRSALRDTSRDQVVKVRYGGRLTVSGVDQGISILLRLFGVYEPATTELIKRVLSRDMACLEIGANIGYYAVLEKKIIGEGELVAIEPSPAISYLRRNLVLNGFQDVKTYDFAMSNLDGVASFYVASSPEGSCITEPYGGTEAKDSARMGIPAVVKVATKRIDTLVREISLKKLDFVRMDVEGHELNVLAGAIETLKRYKPSLLIEIHRDVMGVSKTMKLLKLLAELGYDSKYYVHKDLDRPMVCSPRHDIRQTDMINLSKILTEDDGLAIGLNVFFAPREFLHLV